LKRAERGASEGKWEQGAYKPLKAARSCYSHLAGELGVALYEGLLARGTIVPCDGRYALSESGRAELAALGLDLPVPGAAAARRYAYACLDWSERRDHLAGTLATALLDHALERHWLRRVAGSRALTLTTSGAKALAPWIGMPVQPALSTNAAARAPAQLASQPA